MQRRPLFWLFVSLACLFGAVYFWRLGDEWEAQRSAARALAKTNAAPSQSPAMATKSNSAAAVSPGALVRSNFLAQAAAKRATRLRHRLSNTQEPYQTLQSNEHGLLLANALLDTSKPLKLVIPDSLRAAPDAGSYLVQARGFADASFHALLKEAGATEVSYIPNNAWMVRLSQSGAEKLTADSRVQAVLPYEPYYKLQIDLLNLAVEESPLPEDMSLNLVVFGDAMISTLTSLHQLHAEVVSQSTTPLGPLVHVRPAADSLAQLAQIPGVQLISPWRPRLSANDLTRTTLGITAGPTNTQTYLGLTGTNILITLADAGVDATHPDLVGRVRGDSALSLQDTIGHGTHVAGTILGSGAMSSTVTGAIGSPKGANFQGMAPGAMLYSMSVNQSIGPSSPERVLAGLSVDAIVGNLSDAYLQQRAALTNSLISNNSWVYAFSADYDIAAASYDASVRDALPQISGSQPVLFVFASGNGGAGDEGGLGGNAETVQSPGTSKNGITVGAIEQNRGITNSFVQVIGTNTNSAQIYLASSDANDQVANYSGRGNVGIEVEGPFGRAKPDVVAPGNFVISLQSSTWDTNSYYFPKFDSVHLRADQIVFSGELNPYSVFVPENAYGVVITVETNTSSLQPFPGLQVYVSLSDNPTTNSYDLLGYTRVVLPLTNLALPLGGPLFYSIGNTNSEDINYNLRVDILTTNDLPEVSYFLRTNLNDALGGTFYRYESGSSMAAASVSGMLGLMQEFFEQRVQLTNSPALMKALLINGARSVGQLYDLSVQGLINYQGWGLPILSNSIPGSLSNLVTGGSNQMSMKFYDQSPTNVLSTGQAFTQNLSLTPAGQTQPLRITLVWTDPPGNPAASIKLVNDLDLVITNLDTGDVFYGNDIPTGSIYNQAWATNNPPNVDRVNNVENVYLAQPLGTNYSITVNAHRVNVNAVTGNTNNIVQDFALVISSGDGGALDSAFSISSPGNTISNGLPMLTMITNGVPMMKERTGAHSQYAPTTNGTTAQWSFYVYTNITTYPYVAFVTFLPAELAVSRIGALNTDANNAVRPEPDLDLYVSGNPAILTLDPTVLANASVSRGNGGTEKVLYDNSSQGQVYYIGIKSEGQEAGEYAFLAAASPVPFGRRDPNGNVLLTPLSGLPSLIPDGSPALPGTTNILMISSEPDAVRRVIVTNTIAHPRVGDVINTFTHASKYAVLKNHTPFSTSLGSQTYIYDDSGENDITGSVKSDGPGTMRDFTGQKVASGVWIFNATDDAPTEIGQITGLEVAVEPENPTNHIPFTVQAHSWRYYFIDVPIQATNLTGIISLNTLQLELYFARGRYPSFTDYDKFKLMLPPLDSLSLSLYDSPPLNAGRYFVGIYNPNNTLVSGVLDLLLGLTLQPAQVHLYSSTGNELIKDDAVTFSSIFVPDQNILNSALVNLRIDHPRVSDTALTLISPKGTRVLLSDNRGLLDTNGFGTGYNETNTANVQAAGGNAPDIHSIYPIRDHGTLIIDYDFLPAPDSMHVYYDGALIYDTGYISGPGRFSVDFGPGSATNLVIIMNENGNADPSTEWSYTATVITKYTKYAVLTDDTNYTTVPIKFFPPPFRITNTPTSRLLSDFEAPLAPTNYYAGTDIATNLNTWSVLTNYVTITSTATDTNAIAHTGVQALSLRNGSIGQFLPTKPGDDYVLTFASHRSPALAGLVGWWNGEKDAAGKAIDLVNTNEGTIVGGVQFTAGKVGQAFDFSGAGTRIDVPDSTNLNFGPTSPMSAELWAFRSGAATTMHFFGKRVNCDPDFNYQMAFDLPNGLQFSGSSGDGVFTGIQMPVGVWMHLAATFDGTTFKFYTNGVLVPGTGSSTGKLGPQNNSPLVIGGSGLCENYQGLIDELSIYNRELTQAEITDIYNAGALGKCGTLTPPVECPTCQANVFVNGAQIRTTTGGTNWLTNAISFTANSLSTPIQIEATNCPSGVILDTFVLNDSPGGPYIMPEESLEKLIGESARGLWTLEILDTRAGATNPPPNLVSWQLGLILENTVPVALPLFEGTPVSETINPGGFLYFLVDVPIWAKFATNQLSVATGPLKLYFNAFGEPSGTNAADYLLLNGVTSGKSVLKDTGAQPIMAPGQRYYLGVQNTNSTPVNFTLEVNFDITTLSNAVLVTSTIAPTSVPRYFQFDVTTNAPLNSQMVAAAFEIIAPSGDVNLIAKKGLPLPDLGQVLPSSSNLSSNNEAIVLTTNSSPVALSAGRWYIGVFNNDVLPVSYNVRATEPGKPNLVELTSGVPVTFSSDSGVALTNFFHFKISPATNDSAVLFALSGLTGDVDLDVQLGSLPYVGAFTGGSFLPGTNDEAVSFYTNMVGAAIDGDWYLGVPNNEATNVTYTVLATLADTNGILALRTPFSVALVTPSLSGTSGAKLSFPTIPGQNYKVLISSDLKHWTVASSFTATSSLSTYTDPTPITQLPGRFYRLEKVGSP